MGSPAPGKAVGAKITSVAETIVNIPSLMFRGTDFTSKIAAQQKDAYIDFLIANIINPKENVILRNSIETIKPNIYLLTQTFAKGGLEGVKKALIDANTDQARNTTELIHEGLKDDFNRIFASLSSGSSADGILKREITTLRNTVQKRLSEANPSYRQATEIYNEATADRDWETSY